MAFNVIHLVLSHLQDSDVLRKALAFDSQVFASKQVTFALECCAAFFENDYFSFFLHCTNANLLQLFLLCGHWQDVRLNAIKAIKSSYSPAIPLSLQHFAKVLQFGQHLDDCRMFLVEAGFQVEQDSMIHLHKYVPKEKPQFAKKIAWSFIGKRLEEKNLLQLVLQNFESEPTVTKANFTPIHSNGIAIPKQKQENGYELLLWNSLCREQIQAVASKELLKHTIAIFIFERFLSLFLQQCKSSIAEFCKEAQMQFLSAHCSQRNRIACWLAESMLWEFIKAQCFECIQLESQANLACINTALSMFRLKQLHYRETTRWMTSKVTQLQKHSIFTCSSSALGTGILNVENCKVEEILSLAVKSKAILFLMEENSFCSVYEAAKAQLDNVGIQNFTIIISKAQHSDSRASLLLNYYSPATWKAQIEHFSSKLLQSTHSLKVNNSLRLFNLRAELEHTFRLKVTSAWNFYPQTQCSLESLQHISFSPKLATAITHFLAASPIQRTNINVQQNSKSRGNCCIFHLSSAILALVNAHFESSLEKTEPVVILSAAESKRIMEQFEANCTELVKKCMFEVFYSQ